MLFHNIMLNFVWQSFRSCPRCHWSRRLVPMRELKEGRVKHRDNLFGFPSICVGYYKCRFCGNTFQFRQNRIPSEVLRRIRKIGIDSYFDYDCRSPKQAAADAYRWALDNIRGVDLMTLEQIHSKTRRLYVDGDILPRTTKVFEMYLADAGIKFSGSSSESVPDCREQDS